MSPPHTLAQGSVGERLAHALAYILSPVTLPPLLFGLIGRQLGASRGEIGWLVGIGVLFFGLIPLVILLVLVRRGHAQSVEVRDRSRRPLPFLLGGLSYLASILAVQILNGMATKFMTGFIALLVANVLILTLITTRWKISIHAASMAGFVSVLVFMNMVYKTTASLSPLWIIAFGGLIPLVMWARVRTGAHSWPEVLGGAAFGLLVPLGELWVFLT